MRPMVSEERAGAYNKPTGSQSDQAREDFIKVAFRAGLQDLKLESKIACSQLNFARYRIVIGRVDEECYHGHRWKQLMQ